MALKSPRLTLHDPIFGWKAHSSGQLHEARKEIYSEMLSSLRYMNAQDRSWTTLDDGFKSDVLWFFAYARSANGISLISPVIENIYIECDSSLHGGGGNTDSHFYKWRYTDSHKLKFPLIHQLEAINLLVAYRSFPALHTAGKRVVMVTDNLASSYALSSAKTKDSVLACCARELWLHAARADHELTFEHREGTLIPLADALSREAFDLAKAALARSLIYQQNLTEIPTMLSDYVFFNEI